MPIKANIKIKIGNTQNNPLYLPTVISEGSPYIKWELPEGIIQRRFNLRIKSTHTFAEYIYGETSSTLNYVQWPLGYAMNNNWLGANHIEILISDNPKLGDPFEYSSGSYEDKDKTSIFVFDTKSEVIYNTENAVYKWKPSIDINYGQKLTYQIQVSTHPLITDEIIMDSIIESSYGNIVFTQGKIEIGKTYFWRVRSYDQLDYSSWTIENGFTVVGNVPPKITIYNVFPLNNDYGDVIIDFNIFDPNDSKVSVICTYSGGTVGNNNTKHCSIINNLNKLPNGDHRIVWRSSRDEKLIKAKNYMIQMQGWDGLLYGDIAEYGTFELNNEKFGLPGGGIGSIDLEFPCISKLIKISYDNSYSSGHLCPMIGGGMTDYKGWKTTKDIFPLLSEGFFYYSIYTDGFYLPDTLGLNRADKLLDIEPNNRTFSRDASNDDTNSIPLYPDLLNPLKILEDDGKAPLYTLDPYKLKEDGYPNGISWMQFSNINNRDVYIKIYVSELGYKEQHSIYKYKNWEVIYKNNEYVRKEVNNGLRGIAPNILTANIPITAIISVPYYIKASKIFAPVDYNPTGFCFVGKTYWGHWLYFQGWDRNKLKPPYPYPIIGVKEDKNASPIENGKMIVKFYNDFNDPSLRHIKYTGNIVYPNEYKTLISALKGKITFPRSDYFSGYPTDENPAYRLRREPSWRGDRGFKLVGNMILPQYVDTMRFMYLQSSWDAYNTLHWAATLGYYTKVQIQYAEYLGNNKYLPYKDLMTKDTGFDNLVYMYLVKPQTWSTYIDTVNPDTFEDGKTYKLRMRLVDPVSKTYTNYVYSTDFLISRSAVNPINILNTEWSPWDKKIIITFRADDTNGNTYDIIAMQYTSDGRTWNDINMREVSGTVNQIISNRYGDNINNIITHKIIWDTSNISFPAGSNYRVRIFATLSKLKNNSDAPIFDWSFNPNTFQRQAEIKLRSYLGVTQFYSYNEEENKWEKLDKPIVMPGQIERNIEAIKQIKLQPPPRGVYAYYQDYDPNKQIIDIDGYTKWMNTVQDGVTRSVLLSSIEQQNDEIRNIYIPKLYEQRDYQQMTVRKNLIKQGYYCNGYVNNNINNGIFRWQVEQGPEEMPEPNVNYYDPRYEIYYRIQLDFKQTYDSQNGKPLRDIFFDKNGMRIQNISAVKKELKDTQKNTTQYENYNPEANDKIWSDGNTTDSGNIKNKEEVNNFEDVPYSKYSLPKTDLPGMRKNYFLNYSYPSITDTLPDNVDSFNTLYYFRIAAYNIVVGDRIEGDRSLIDDIKIYPSSNKIEFSIYAKSDESTNQLKIRKYKHYLNENNYVIKTKWEWSKEKKIPTWENKQTVVFLTDRPVDDNGKIIQDDKINANITIEGTDRISPRVFITNDHQYKMFYSRKNIYDENIIVQALGKNSNTFGEYDYPFINYPIKSIKKELNFSDLYSPYMIHGSNEEMMIWVTGVKDNKNKIYFSFNYTLMELWSYLTECEGLDDCYYPSVMIEDNIYKMWCCKVIGGLSKIVYFSSDNGMKWNQNGIAYSTSNNLNSPYVIKTSNGYLMFFTEYEQNNSKIASVFSSDGINWENYEIEIDDGNCCNPCIVLDVYGGKYVYRMYYNQIINGKYIIKTAILEDRIWNNGDAIIIPEIMIPTIQGNKYTGIINMNANNMNDLTEDSDIKIRLFYDNDSGKKDYLVQSEWHSKNSDEDSVFISPNGVWRYHEIWKSLNYDGA